MRVSIGCAVLAAGLLSVTVSAQEAKKKPQTSEASKKTPGKEDVKVYTNDDLEKMFGIVAGEDREQPPVKPPATAKGSENVEPQKAPDPPHLAPATPGCSTGASKGRRRRRGRGYRREAASDQPRTPVAGRAQPVFSPPGIV